MRLFKLVDQRDNRFLILNMGQQKGDDLIIAGAKPFDILNVFIEFSYPIGDQLYIGFGVRFIGQYI